MQGYYTSFSLTNLWEDIYYLLTYCPRQLISNEFEKMLECMHACVYACMCVCNVCMYVLIDVWLCLCCMYVGFNYIYIAMFSGRCWDSTGWHRFTLCKLKGRMFVWCMKEHFIHFIIISLQIIEGGGDVGGGGHCCDVFIVLSNNDTSFGGTVWGVGCSKCQAS